MSLMQMFVMLWFPLLCVSQDSFFCDDFSNAGNNWNSQTGQLSFPSNTNVNSCSSNCMKIGPDATIYSDSIPVINKKSIYMQYNLDLCEYNTNDWDYLYIRVKIDGGTWGDPIKTYANGGCDMFNEIATFPSSANGASTIQIQFQSDTWPGMNAYVDNLCLYGTPITMQPTTTNPTTSTSTTSTPTTSTPTTAIPTTMQPTIANPTTSVPSTSMPSTIQPTTINPTSDSPTTAQSTTSQPTDASITTISTTNYPTISPTYRSNAMPTTGGEGIVDTKNIFTTLTSDENQNALNEPSGMYIYLIIGFISSFCALFLLFILCKYYLSKRNKKEHLKQKQEQQHRSHIQLGSASERNEQTDKMQRIQSVSMSPGTDKNGENDFGENLTNLAGVNNVLMDDVINDVNSPETVGNDDSNEDMIVTPNGDDEIGNISTEGTDSNNDDVDIQLVSEGNIQNDNVNNDEFIIDNDIETLS